MKYFDEDELKQIKIDLEKILDQLDRAESETVILGFGGIVQLDVGQLREKLEVIYKDFEAL